MSLAALHAHLKTGLTQTCHCWAITRRDGVVLGFTDHDRDLAFAGIVFKADSGMSARVVSQTTGLAVDNTEAVGALSDDRITATDIAVGRYDNAEVKIWQVQWDNVAARALRFRGNLGEITRTGGAFQADLRGLSERLNQPQGRSYLKTCTAVLGDAACRVDTVNDLRFVTEIEIDRTTDGQNFDVVTPTAFNDHWFAGGVITGLRGAAQGLSAVIKRDDLSGGRRLIGLWQPLGISIALGDRFRLVAGCDKQGKTCREKFANFANFQGFPHIPGDDWMLAVPRASGTNDGGSLQ